MVSSEFNKRKEILSNYFRHPRWSYHGEDDWEFEYYKGKRNMQELEAALKEIIAEVSAAGPQDMGKVMGVATKKLAGKAEGRAISAKVKELLG